MSWYRVVFWRADDDLLQSDALEFVEDYCRMFRAAGLRIPAAFGRRSETGHVYFLNPLASAFYFTNSRRSLCAQQLLANGAARPCIEAPDISLCVPVTCGK